MKSINTIVKVMIPTKTKIAFSFCLIVYIIVSLIKIFDDEPYIKELQILQFAEKHSKLGLGFTKGFNLYSESDSSYFDQYKIQTRNLLNLGGINFPSFTKYIAYISAPPGIPILCSAIFLFTGENWFTIRMLFILSGILVLYLCLILSLLFFNNNNQVFFLLFSLTPFTLMHYYYADININAVNLSIFLMCYLSFLNFLLLKGKTWKIIFSLTFFINVWFSFFSLSIIPLIALHLIMDYRFSVNEKRKIIVEFCVLIIVTFLSVYFYYSNIDGAIAKLFSRIIERISGTNNILYFKDLGYVPLKAFLIRIVVRMNTHYTPIVFILAGIGLGYSLFSLIQKLKNQGVFSIDTLDARFINIMFFIFGIPTGFLLYTGSFIHKYFIYYFSIFFTFSSTISFSLILNSIKIKWRTIFLYSTILIFLSLSISRAVIKNSNSSLIDLLYDGEVPNWYKQP